MAPATRSTRSPNGANPSPTSGAAPAASSSDMDTAPSSASTLHRSPAASGDSALPRAGCNPDDLCRLQYDADGEAAAAHDHVHVASFRRRAAHPGLRQEAGGLALLVLLYLVQGVPLGLTTGALPFMLSSKLSYTQMGIFALAAYPYSLKLLWSPVVDCLHLRRLGRRKSWILPIQLATAYLLIAWSDTVQALYERAEVVPLTALFLVFVFLMATQDIAVDGWALTLLSPANVAYASTCQTVGQTTGIFTSFTVFLALQDAAFCNKFIRGSSLLGGLVSPTPSDSGLVSLAGYMRFWGWVFLVVTAFIGLCVREAADVTSPPLSQQDRLLLGLTEGDDGDSMTTTRSGLAGPRPGGAGSGKPSVSTNTGDRGGDVGAAGGGSQQGVFSELACAYVALWRVVKLPAVWRLSALLLSYRVGVLAAEGAASLKLIDKGVAKEALAFLVLFQFPVELLSAVVAGRWAASHSPYPPFITGYLLRLTTAAATVALTAAFPPAASSLSQHPLAFGALAAVSLATSFVSYLSFTALGSFFNTVSDPGMGGAYLTLLNTIANMGYMLPRMPLFWLMDVLTVPQCKAAGGAEGGRREEVLPYSCPKKLAEMARGESECAAAGGVCGLAADGYYIVSGVSLVVGVVFGVWYLRFVRGVMRAPLASWRAGAGASDVAESKRRE